MKNQFIYGLPALFIITFLLSFNNNKSLLKEEQPLKNLTNIQYGENVDTIGENNPLNMDIYFPKGATTAKKYPLVMMIHGGGFREDMKKETLGAACQALADSGFVAVTINYRMGYKIKESKNLKLLNTQLAASYRAFQDANAAMRFLISKAKDYAIDTSGVFVGGGSAGAITALAVAYITDGFYEKSQPEFVTGLGGLHNSGNKLKDTYSIKGICSMWGALPDSTLITKSNAIPTIFFHGTADAVIPIDKGYGSSRLYGTLCLYRQLRKYKKPAIAHIMPGGKHVVKEYKQKGSFSFPMKNTICFFKSVLNNTAHRGIYYKMDGSCTP